MIKFKQVEHMFEGDDERDTFYSLLSYLTKYHPLTLDGFAEYVLESSEAVLGGLHDGSR